LITTAIPVLPKNAFQSPAAAPLHQLPSFAKLKWTIRIRNDFVNVETVCEIIPSEFQLENKYKKIIFDASCIIYYTPATFAS
jgi:hypothetical protein